MEIGVTLPTFVGYNDKNEWIVPPNRLRQFARKAEELGFSSLWAPDHLTPPPYYEWGAALDPLVMLSHAANVTDTISLGTNILILPLRNPVMVANRVASLQHLSEGRLSLGVGAGYVEGEFEAANVPYRERYARFSEGIELLNRLLKEESVTFDGDFWQVEDLHIEPDNARPPTILAAGAGRKTDDGRAVSENVMERVHISDGWIAGPWHPDAAESDWQDIQGYLREHEENPDRYGRSIVTMTHLFPNLQSDEARKRQRTLIEQFSDWEWGKQNYLLGNVEDIKQYLHRFEAIGFEEVIFLPLTKDLHELDRQLELWNEYLMPMFH